MNMNEKVKQEWEALKSKVRKAGYTASQRSNEQTRQAYDDAINEIMVFEKEHNIAE